MAKTVEEIADAMFNMVSDAQGQKKLKPMDLTKAMVSIFGDVTWPCSNSSTPANACIRISEAVT